MADLSRAIGIGVFGMLFANAHGAGVLAQGQKLHS